MEKSPSKSPPSQIDGNQYNIYFIRHSISCANVMKLLGKAGVVSALKNFLLSGKVADDRAIYAPNSPLTYSGFILSLLARSWLSQKINTIEQSGGAGESENSRQIQTIASPQLGNAINVEDLKLASPQHVEDDENYSGIPDDNQQNYDRILNDVY